MHDEESLSFVVCSSDDAILRSNLLASPCLTEGPGREVIAIRKAPSAADGLSMGITRAAHELVVCVHQDVYLPAGWDRLMLNQYRIAERQSGPIGVAGVYGVGPAADGPDGLAARRIGWVEDRGRVLSEGPGWPARVGTLDEVITCSATRTAGPARSRGPGGDSKTQTGDYPQMTQMTQMGRAGMIHPIADVPFDHLPSA